MDLKELRAKGKELNIPHAHVMGEEKLLVKIVEKEAEMSPKEPEVPVEEPKVEEPIETPQESPEPVEMAVPTPGPTMPPRDVENPDSEGLAQRQAKASQEARIQALEERLLLAESRADIAEERSKSLESTVAKKPTREVPERPNPNTMVYFKDGEDKDGKPIIKHKQVSFAEAAILLEKDEYGKSPAYFQ
jgi:hypothetical protein